MVPVCAEWSVFWTSETWVHLGRRGGDCESALAFGWWGKAGFVWREQRMVLLCVESRVEQEPCLLFLSKNWVWHFFGAGQLSHLSVLSIFK